MIVGISRACFVRDCNKAHLFREKHPLSRRGCKFTSGKVHFGNELSLNDLAGALVFAYLHENIL